jgi:hypothetical protein
MLSASATPPLKDLPRPSRSTGTPLAKILVEVVEHRLGAAAEAVLERLQDVRAFPDHDATDRAAAPRSALRRRKTHFWPS